MKKIIDEYIDVIMYTISGILLILGSYNILINFNHYSFLNEKVIVQKNDYEYQKFQENVLKIEEILQKENNSPVSKVLTVMKKNGAYRLLPGDKLGYNELYELNNYFLEELINEGWISNLRLNKEYDNSYNNAYVNILISDANYVNKEMLNNSNYHYDIKSNDIRNALNEEYRLIMRNYYNFSLLVLNIMN